MACININSLSFAYEGRKENALSDISLSIDSGEFVCLCGKSASGKSTLLRLIKSEVSPGGEMMGDISFGDDIKSSEIGYIMQNPDEQIVTDKVWHELAFGLENIGIPKDEIRRRVSETAVFFGIEPLMQRDTDTLSGGEKQLVNLASAAAMSPKILLLDEPTSKLSPSAEDLFLAVLERLNRELGMTVIISTHETDKIFPISDRIIILEDGCLKSFLSPAETISYICAEKSPMLNAMPCEVRIFSSLGFKEIPCGIAEARAAVAKLCESDNPKPVPPASVSDLDNILTMSDVCFRYEKNSRDILKNLNFSVKRGEVFALLGGNGAGKSTLFSVISRQNSAQYGKIKNLAKKTALLPQDVTAVFLHDNVFEDLSDMALRPRVDEIMKLCKITHLGNMHPYDLSGGEQMRTALAKILLTDAELLLLDEPTRGLDADSKALFGKLLRNLAESGKTVVIASHDLEFCAEFCDRAGMLANGDVLGAGSSQSFFSSNMFFTTPTARIARGIIPNAVTPGDIASSFGKTLRITGAEDKRKEKTEKSVRENENGKRAVNKAEPPSVFIPILFAVLMAITALAGVFVLDDRHYYAVSLALVIEATAPFIINFAKRKYKPHHLSLTAVMTAAAVVSRAAFFAVPQFKPLAAVVILAGAALGADSGFMVGALSAVVSNMLFGQGPWTPWQMLALGVIGFLSGILFFNRTDSKTKYLISLFGFCSVFAVYGGIMNMSSLLMWQRKLTLEMLMITYAQGIPFDLVHALGTFVFLILTAEPIISKLKRAVKRR